jgi:hypothetical protein
MKRLVPLVVTPFAIAAALVFVGTPGASAGVLDRDLSHASGGICDETGSNMCTCHDYYAGSIYLAHLCTVV